MKKGLIVIIAIIFLCQHSFADDDSIFMRVGFFPENEPDGLHGAAQLGIYHGDWHYAIGFRVFGVYENGWAYRNYVDSALQYSCPHVDFTLYQINMDSSFVIDFSVGRRINDWLSVDAFVSPGYVEAIYQRLEKSNVTGLWYAPAPVKALAPTIDGGIGLTVMLGWFDVSLSYSYRAGVIIGAGYRFTGG